MQGATRNLHVLNDSNICETLRNTRHHYIRSLIATALRERDFTVYEEVHGVSLEGSHRRIDMIAIPASSVEGYIIDPTIRTESYEDQPIDVHEDKCNIYVPTLYPFIRKNIT
ncbi:hypothetical protein C0J52_18906 [Blattella germanica]|nr:hypothetical protein C0J52_18906 [Blattella germanica]